jgi:CRP-like cAMP-binding protein
MDWVPYFLILASGAFLIPMLISFQRRMGEMDRKIREGKTLIRESEENAKRFLEEEGRVKKEMEQAKANLAEVDKEREVEEAKFRDLKKQLMSDDDECQIKQLIAVVQKLAIFQGLAPAEIQRVLQICRLQRYEAGQQVYRRGDPSSEMLIMIQGSLMVLSAAGAELAEMKAGMTIGEMGLFAEQPRSADIVAQQPAMGFAIRKAELDMVLKANREMLVKVQQNVIRMLAVRLQETNVKLDRYGDTIERLRKRIEKLVGMSEEEPDEDKEGADKDPATPEAT